MDAALEEDEEPEEEGRRGRVFSVPGSWAIYAPEIARPHWK